MIPRDLSSAPYTDTNTHTHTFLFCIFPLFFVLEDWSSLGFHCSRLINYSFYPPSMWLLWPRPSIYEPQSPGWPLPRLIHSSGWPFISRFHCSFFPLAFFSRLCFSLSCFAPVSFHFFSFFFFLGRHNMVLYTTPLVRFVGWLNGFPHAFYRAVVIKVSRVSGNIS